MSVEVPWIIFGGVVLGVVVISYAIAKYYSDPENAEKLPTLAVTLGLTFSLLVVLMVPVDIYLVATTRDSSGEATVSPEEVVNRGDNVRMVYYALYGAILSLAFFFIPFAYFFYEEDDIDVTNRDRVVGSLKYTSFLLAFFVIILVIGLMLRVGKNDDDATEREWVDKLFDAENAGDGAIAFCVAILAILGYMCMITYTAYGLSALPVFMLRKMVSNQQELKTLGSEATTTLNVNRERMRAIKDKYAYNTEATMTAAERRQLRNLERKEKALTERTQKLEKEERWEKFSVVCVPFKFIFGTVFLLFSLLLIVSLTMTAIDKFTNSICGWSCGYVLDEPTWVNPFDTTVMFLSEYFPADYVFIGFTIFYVLFATLSGLTRIGVRFFWLHMYRIRRRSSVPQGLLFVAAILMLVVLALNIDLTTLAPQYSSFGVQKYIDPDTGDLLQCTVEAPGDVCAMSQVAVLVNRITVKTPFFAVVFFSANFVFVSVFVLGLLVSCFKRIRRDDDADSDDDDDDDERESLLRHSNRR